MKEIKRVYSGECYKWEDDGKTYAVEFVTDDYPEDPRLWSNVGRMICDWNRYDLGDRKDGSVEDELLRLVRDTCSEEEVIEAALGENSKLETIRLIKDDDPEAEEDDYVLQAWCEWRTVFNRGPARWEDLCHIKKDYAYDEILDAVQTKHCLQLLENDVEILPLSVYEHSGITMYVGAPCDRFDSGYAGFIYITKREAFKNFGGITEENWRERADECMRSEVEVYDHYLTGEVLGYNIYEKSSQEDEEEEWEDIDSCYGFYGHDTEESGILEELGYGFSKALEEDRVTECEHKEEKTVFVRHSFC